jgi:type II secretory pathway pseudopilin PulG
MRRISTAARPPLSAMPRGRSAFSLFEVLIALGIFAFSLAAIGQLISNGMRGALQSKLQTQATFLCESKLAELVSGIAPLQSARETPFPDDAAWTWSVDLQAGPQPDLYVVKVTVDQVSGGLMGALTYSLCRVLRDPDAVLLMEQQKAQLLQQYQQQQSTSGVTSGSGSSGSSGGSR